MTHYARRDNGAWERRDVTDLDASVELESIGCALKLRDIYDGVTFDTWPPAAAKDTVQVS